MLLGRIFSWIFALLFVVVGLAMLGMGGTLQAILFFCIALILLPPFRYAVQKLAKQPLPWWAWALGVVILWGGFIFSLTLNPQTSIFINPEAENKLMSMYEAQLAQWPTPCESVFIDTEYGKVHVIVSGPEEAPPVLLIHASAMGGWSWRCNVADLNKYYRTYAVDSIGDVGKSVLADLKNPLSGGENIARFYSDVTDKLGLQEAFVVGASVGGYMGTEYALHAPERVKKLALLCPMGYGHTNQTIALMVLAQAFPLNWIQQKTSEWALGTAPHVQQEFNPWFVEVISGTMPKPTPPVSFTSENLQTMEVPVLAFFGKRDQVIGDAKSAKIVAGNIPDSQVRIEDSGHLVGAELPDLVNQALIEFFND